MSFARILACAACAAAIAIPSAAQTTVPEPAQPAGASLPAWGWVDFGVRATTVDGDEDRFERYRDVGDGAFLQRARWARDGGTWFISADADNAGRRDQRYRGTFEQTGRLRASFQWDQIPLTISRDTRTPYTEEGRGILRINDAIQQGIQSRQLTLASVVPIAEILETRYRRDTASLGIELAAGPDIDFRGSLSTARKHGRMPWGASFGFNLAVEVPAPIETRTTDAKVELEWTRGGSVVRLAYDGSWFRNDIESLIWDNPIRLTDTTSPNAYVSGEGTATGRMSLWPSNQMHTVAVTGTAPLPRRSRASATVAFGAATQNARVLPFTINSAIAPIELPRERAEANVRIAVANLLFTSRPWRHVGFTARYRLNDRHNRTEHFDVVDRVRIDQVRELFDPNNLGKEGPEFYSITRQTFDVEAAYTPLTFTSLRAGYSHARTDRTFRIFEDTTEDTVRASADAGGNPWFTVRGQVERSRRKGRHFEQHVLDIVGEQPGMRHFDVADRDRTRVTGIATLTPLPYLGLNASVAAGNDDFPESPFGLRDNDHRVYTVGADVTAGQASLSVSYARERYSAFQLSRQANPGTQFGDPTRDWGTDADERVNSVLASFDIGELLPRTAVRLSYDFSRSATDYVYVLGSPGAERTLPEGSPITTLPPVQQLPQVSNEIHTARLDTRYFITRQLAAGIVYWYERYRVEDYALGDETIRRIDLPNGLLMYYRYRPYDAHSVWLRLTYLF